MTMVYLILAGGLILVGAVLALKTFRKPDTADPRPKPKPPLSESVSKPSPRIDPAKADSPGAMTIAAYPDAAGISKDLRAHLIKGIDKIFMESDAVSEGKNVPLTRDQVHAEKASEILAQLEELDRFRASQFELQKLLNDPRSQLAELSKNVTSDPLLTAKVLKMANSPYFGFTQKIDSIGHALMILGLQNVKNIIYREGLRGLFEAGPAHNREAAAQLWRHSNLVCICTQHFHDLFEGLHRGTLFTLGIVHDIGKLILMNLSRKTIQKNAPAAEYPMDILIGEEDQLFGINHAVIGSYALEQWNFSELMIQSVAMHHAPSFMEAGDVNTPPDTQKYILALFLADQIAKLYADWNHQAAHIYPLLKSYHPLIDKKKLLNKVIDIGFLNQLQAAQALAVSEQPFSPKNNTGR